MTKEEARQIAAQCWCTEETRGIEKDDRLANAFADKLVEVVNSMPDMPHPLDYMA